MEKRCAACRCSKFGVQFKAVLSNVAITVPVY